MQKLSQKAILSTYISFFIHFDSFHSSEINVNDIKRQLEEERSINEELTSLMVRVSQVLVSKGVMDVIASSEIEVREGIR